MSIENEEADNAFALKEANLRDDLEQFKNDCAEYGVEFQERVAEIVFLVDGEGS